MDIDWTKVSLSLQEASLQEARNVEKLFKEVLSTDNPTKKNVVLDKIEWSLHRGEVYKTLAGALIAGITQYGS